MAIVYRHRTLKGQIFYIGIAKFESRPYCVNSRNTHWKNVFNKHGRTVEIIQENISWEDACELEVLLIQEYGRKDLGLGNLVNMTNGGEGAFGVIVSDEKKLKLSESAKKRTGINAARYNANSKRQIKLLNKDNPKPYPKGVYSVLYGVKRPDFSETIKGTNNPFFGKTHSLELVAKMSRRILDTVSGIEYPSIKKASESLNMHPTTLRWHLSIANKNKTSLIYLDPPKIRNFKNKK